MLVKKIGKQIRLSTTPDTRYDLNKSVAFFVYESVQITLSFDLHKNIVLKKEYFYFFS